MASKRIKLGKIQRTEPKTRTGPVQSRQLTLGGQAQRSASQNLVSLQRQRQKADREKNFSLVRELDKRIRAAKRTSK